MIAIFQTGEFEYDNVDKPVHYTMDNLIEVASRTSSVNITDEHTKEVIDVMSNFIVDDGLLKCDEPENLDLKGMGFSPVFKYDLIDMGDYYVPFNIRMLEIGYTTNPKTRIVYNSIENPNGDNIMDDKQLRQALDENKKLQEEIGVLKSQNKQLSKKLKDKDKEIKEIRDSYVDTDKKLKEYDSLKETESKYNKLISSRRDDLIHQIAGKDEKKAEKFKDYTVEQLETTLDLIKGQKKVKGLSPKTNPVDDGNNPNPEDDEKDEDIYTDEMFEADFKASGL